MCTHGRTSMGTRENKLTQAVVPSVAACGGLHMSVLHPTRRRRASPSRFAPRTCTPAPSHGPNFDAQSTRPQSRGDFFRPFRTPQIGVGGWPSPGSAVLQLVVVWQAKKAVAVKKAAEEEAEKVPSSPHWMDAVSVALRATRAHALIVNNVFIHTRVRCVGPPRVRSRVVVRTAGRLARLRVRSHCCSRWQH